jgi:hypothetical protein
VPLRCPEGHGGVPVAYDDPSLIGRAGDNTVASWNVRDRLGRELVLHDGQYLCPACNAFTMRFADGGLMWD